MKRLMVRLDKCTGCKRCEQACIGTHSGRGSYVGAALAQALVPTSIYVESAGEKGVPVVCRHCTEPLCVSACMAGCMQKDPDTGVVTNVGHEQKCVGCWMCVMSCPFGVIGTCSANGAPFDRAVKCDFCPDQNTPACVEACPDNAIEVFSAD